MTLRRPALLALAAVFGTVALAQSQAPGSISSRRPTSASPRALRPVKPDPDLLDGSIYEAEKRPLYGMMSEVELPGSEQKSEKVGGEPKPSGNSSDPAAQRPAGSPPPNQQQAAAQGQPPPIDSGQDDRQDPSQQQQQQQAQAEAEGIRAASLEGPQTEGADQQQSRPRDMQIGDATLQIQTLPQNVPQVVGTEQPTSTQQYEKKVPQGQQTDNRNRGSEKGQVMPKGI